MFRKSIYSDDDIQFHIYLMSDGSRSFFFGFLANDGLAECRNQLFMA